MGFIELGRCSTTPRQRSRCYGCDAHFSSSAVASSTRCFGLTHKRTPKALSSLLPNRASRHSLALALAPPRGVADDRLSMSEVGAVAYRLELEPFHSWFLKNTFSMAINALPRRCA